MLTLAVWEPSQYLNPIPSSEWKEDWPESSIPPTCVQRYWIHLKTKSNTCGWIVWFFELFCYLSTLLRRGRFLLNSLYSFIVGRLPLIKDFFCEFFQEIFAYKLCGGPSIELFTHNEERFVTSIAFTTRLLCVDFFFDISFYTVLNLMHNARCLEDQFHFLSPIHVTKNNQTHFLFHKCNNVI